MAPPEYPFLSVEDYLNLDRNSKETRYEFIDGVLRMLAGGSVYHSIIATNLLSILHGRLRNSSCWVYNSDMRLQLSASRYVYPDITISCDRRDQVPGDTLSYPRVVVEVLSPSTELYDRTRKFSYYQGCLSMQDYILVDSQSVQVDIYHRNTDDSWTLHTFGPGGQVKVESLGLQFPIDEVYERIGFDQEL